jgi:hypothetical protein
LATLVHTARTLTAPWARAGRAGPGHGEDSPSLPDAHALMDKARQVSGSLADRSRAVGGSVAVVWPRCSSTTSCASKVEHRGGGPARTWSSWPPNAPARGVAPPRPTARTARRATDSRRERGLLGAIGGLDGRRVRVAGVPAWQRLPALRGASRPARRLSGISAQTGDLWPTWRPSPPRGTGMRGHRVRPRGRSTARRDPRHGALGRPGPRDRRAHRRSGRHGVGDSRL